MAIKAIINNTEKEIEQIKNSDEQDIDYVYSRIGDTEAEGEPPISIKSIGGELADYRIYGNTAGGESVGDLVAEGEHAGEYKVAVKVEGKNLCNNIWEQKAINADSGNASPNVNAVCCDFIPVKPNVTYSCSRTIANNYNNLRCYGTNKNYLGTGADLANKGNPLKQRELFGTFMITDARVSYIRFNDLSNSLDTKYMLVEGVYTAETMPPYEPYHAPVTTPIYLPEPIKMVGDEAEYIDYAEQKMHRIGADDIDVTLPALSTIKGTNTFSVNTSIQPSNIYIKDGFDYKRVFTATRTIEGESPLNYRSIEDSDSTLSNYRIYGNTVVGESVGDRTVNILPLSRTPITETHGDFLCEYDGLGTITLTTDKDNAITDGEFVIPLIQNFTIPVSIEQGGTGCFQINNSISGDASNNIKLYYNNTLIDTWNLNELNRVHSKYTAMSNKTIDSISVRINNGGTNRKITIKPAFVEKVTEQVPFEPYGYKIPVTLTADSAETTNIFLDAPLAKSGDNADYIDYATQKRHNSDGTESTVILPEIAVAAGTNTLTVGTEVQPSSVYLKGKIKKKPKIYYKIYYYSQDGQTALSTETVEEGHDCTYSTVPTKESDTDFDYTFTGWSTTTNQSSPTSGATTNIQQDTNLYAAFSKSFKTDTISDSWKDIITACNNGTYSGKYQVGDLKTIDVGTEGPVQMQIVAIDTDLLASDNTKKAPITWISKQLLNTYKAMHRTPSNYLSDWANCDMRTYLRGAILPMLPSVVQNGIKEVTKYTCKRTSSTTWTTVSATENIWLPSYREVSNATSNCETSGVQYNSIFTNNASRVKSKTGNSAYYWWTRSASGDSNSVYWYCFAGVDSNGSASYGGYYCTLSSGVAIGFCT